MRTPKSETCFDSCRDARISLISARSPKELMGFTIAGEMLSDDSPTRIRAGSVPLAIYVDDELNVPGVRELCVFVYKCGYFDCNELIALTRKQIERVNLKRFCSTKHRQQQFHYLRKLSCVMSVEAWNAKGGRLGHRQPHRTGYRWARSAPRPDRPLVLTGQKSACSSIERPNTPHTIPKVINRVFKANHLM